MSKREELRSKFQRCLPEETVGYISTPRSGPYNILETTIKLDVIITVEQLENLSEKEVAEHVCSEIDHSAECWKDRIMEQVTHKSEEEISQSICDNLYLYGFVPSEKALEFEKWRDKLFKKAKKEADEIDARRAKEGT